MTLSVKRIPFMAIVLLTIVFAVYGGLWLNPRTHSDVGYHPVSDCGQNHGYWVQTPWGDMCLGQISKSEVQRRVDALKASNPNLVEESGSIWEMVFSHIQDMWGLR